ncbi:hypothetical protein ACQPU1_18025, partial [Clostridium paraputrificum]
FNSSIKDVGLKAEFKTMLDKLENLPAGDIKNKLIKDFHGKFDGITDADDAGIMKIIGDVNGKITEGVGNRNKFNFGNEKKFDKHFDKHVIKQGEFGNITKDDYLKLANEFIDSSGKNVLSRTASNGDILKFNNKTNEFSIVTKDGVVRTYHKLDPQIHGKGTNLDYWNSPDCNY